MKRRPRHNEHFFYAPIGKGGDEKDNIAVGSPFVLSLLIARMKKLIVRWGVALCLHCYSENEKAYSTLRAGPGRNETQ